MNKFLAAFLDHVSNDLLFNILFQIFLFIQILMIQALKDLDYEVREKLFVEQLLDIEFCDSLDRGVFYIGMDISDNKHKCW